MFDLWQWVDALLFYFLQTSDSEAEAESTILDHEVEAKFEGISTIHERVQTTHHELFSPESLRTAWDTKSL